MKIVTENFGEVILMTSPALIGATENLAFKTDIFQSKNGDETRIPLKDKARQTLGFSSLAVHSEVAKNFNSQWGGIRKNWAVPLFQESQDVGNVSADFVMCRTDIYSFYDGCMALLKNETQFVLVEVETVEQDRLLLANVANIANAKLYPVRLCFISGDITRRISGIYANASVSFIVVDEPEVDESQPVQFLGEDLYFFKLTYSGGSMETSLSQQQNIVDSGVGVIFQNTDWGFARYSKQYRTLLRGHEELYAFRQFLFRRRGMYRPFWLPTYESNLHCKNTGTVATILLVEADQYKQLADQRKHIAIKSSGIWSAHTVTASALTSPNTVQLTIVPALNKPASSIQRISYLGLHRLDADSVALNYQGASIIEVSVPILEIGV